MQERTRYSEQRVHGDPEVVRYSKELELVINNGTRMYRPTSRCIMARNGYIAGVDLGSGSYSKVKLARDVGNNDELVAVKIVDRAMAPHDYQQTFLPRELNTWPHIVHPNIIRHHETFQETRRIFMVLEYVSGGDLLTFVQASGAVGERRARSWFSQICEAMCYVHSLECAHRDLKLENILLTGDLERIKICDFGFVTDTGSELSDIYCGSRSYAAPEILLGKPYDPKKADIWALGVILYILVVGRMPFDETRGVGNILSEQHSLSMASLSKAGVTVRCQRLMMRIFAYQYRERPTVSDILTDDWFNEEPEVASVVTRGTAHLRGRSHRLVDEPEAQRPKIISTEVKAKTRRGQQTRNRK